MRSVLIGFSGGSCSGKSTLVDAIAEHLADLAPARLTFDRYYRPLDHLTLAERDRINFDHPDSLDDELFVAHLQALRDGLGVDVPVYDFATHSRLAEPDRIEPSMVVLVDGILLLADPRAAQLLDVSVFLDVDADLRLERRIARDTVERGRSEESVRRQFAESVAPMHDRFVQPSGERADRVIRWPADFKVESAALAEVIRTLLPAQA
ncbi:MAG: uridine kinase [Proteobacteria bacterium]|nr:uridine kinase [Pseudomonadota bacterium]